MSDSWYTHTVSVVVTTQFKYQDGKDLLDEIQNSLGPWSAREHMGILAFNVPVPNPNVPLVPKPKKAKK